MDLQELLDLIAIRGWLVNSVANPIFDRQTVRDLDGILILVDQKIAGLLISPEFKTYIGYANIKQAIQEVRRVTNIKSSLPLPPK